MRPPLAIPALLNARDLGDHPTTDGQRTRSGSLVRSDDLAQLTPEGLRALQAYGIVTVVDLRWPQEAERWPSPVPRSLPNLNFLRVSLLTHTEDEWRLRTREVPKELWNVVVLERVGPELRRALSAIAGAPAGGLIFHCVAGKDRTGIIAALLLALADVEPAAIAQDYAASGENLREAYLRRYPDTEPERILEILRCPEEGAYNMMKFLADAGGTRAYLAKIGLTDTEISVLRARLRS